MVGHDRVDGWNNRRTISLLAALALAAAVFAMTGASSSSADVTALNGSASGFSYDVVNPGGPFTQAPGCPCPPSTDPIVTLPPAGSAVPLTAAGGPDQVFTGPAEIISYTGITVSTQGTLGPTGSVASSSTISGLNFDAAEPLTATTLASSCSASSTGVLSGTTTITGGTLQTDSGDPRLPPNFHPPVTVALPTNPAPNTIYNGHLHVGATQDNFQYILNEQVVTANSITVNAAHLRFLGPLVTGDLYIGTSICGVTVSAVTTTTAPATTTTTRPATTTTTRPATTTTTTVPSGPTCLGQRATLVGTEGNDRLIGTPGNDVIVGLGGDDSIYGLDGNDIICGGDGNDIIDGGAGNDILDGQAGNDRVIGGLGNDDVRGGPGSDRVFANEGDNLLDGGPGAPDYCYKGTGITTFTNCEVYPAGM